MCLHIAHSFPEKNSSKLCLFPWLVVYGNEISQSNMNDDDWHWHAGWLEPYDISLEIKLGLIFV